MYDVFFFEAFEEERRNLEALMPPTVKCGFTGRTIQESGKEVPPARIISIRTQSTIPENWLPSFDAVLARSTGYDHLLKIEEKKPDIKCGYLPLYCSRSVAEQAMLLWMALMRRLSLQQRQLCNFNRDGLTGRECSGKNLVVVGVGNIGYEVARIGTGLGMLVFGVDLEMKHEDIDYVALDDGLERADVIVCAMNLTKENNQYFSYNVLSKSAMAPIFINVARGEFCPVADLLRLLDENKLSGVGLDVYPDESDLAVELRYGAASGSFSPVCKEIQKLCSRTNVIMTPHNAFNTVEAVERKAAQSIEQIEHFQKSGRFKWPIPLV